MQVTFFTNSLTVLGMVVSTAANGNLWEFLSFVAANGTAASYMVRLLLLLLLLLL